jgi:hypothetical protein
MINILYFVNLSIYKLKKYICEMEFIIIYPVFIGMALATAQLAHQKGYRARWWLLFGLLVPVISTAILFTLKKKHKPQTGFHALVDNNNNDRVLYKRD